MEARKLLNNGHKKINFAELLQDITLV